MTFTHGASEMMTRKWPATLRVQVTNHLIELNVPNMPSANEILATRTQKCIQKPKKWLRELSSVVNCHIQWTEHAFSILISKIYYCLYGKICIVIVKCVLLLYPRFVSLLFVMQHNWTIVKLNNHYNVGMQLPEHTFDFVLCTQFIEHIHI